MHKKCNKNIKLKATFHLFTSLPISCTVVRHTLSDDGSHKARLNKILKLTMTHINAYRSMSLSNNGRSLI